MGKYSQNIFNCCRIIQNRLKIIITHDGVYLGLYNISYPIIMVIICHIQLSFFLPLVVGFTYISPLRISQ